MERITKFTPAYDKRSTDPKKDYGIGDVRAMMVLKGTKGAIHFIFGTGMFLPESVKEGVAKHGVEFFMYSHSGKPMHPMGYDVGYHSLTPGFEGQEVYWPTKMTRKDEKLEDAPLGAPTEKLMETLSNIEFVKVGDKAPDCEWLGAPCYCDGSALRAEEWMDILLREGSDKIWEMLEEEYKVRFEELV